MFAVQKNGASYAARICFGPNDGRTFWAGTVPLARSEVSSPTEAKPPAPERAPRRKPKARDLSKARDHENSGRRAVFRGDLKSAKEHFRLCLRAAEYADCHRGLGIIYASHDEPELAIKHYSRYIQLKPDAPDAPRVRALIKQASRR